MGTDDDVPPDSTDLAPDVTSTNEPAGDKTGRQTDEDAGTTPARSWVVQTGHKLERNGVLVEAGATVWFTPAEIAAGNDVALQQAGVIN